MANPQKLIAVLGTSCILTLALAAQDETEEKPAPPPNPQEVLAKGIRRMAQLNAVTFRTTEIQDSAMSRRIAKQVGAVLGGAGEVAVRGSWSDHILRAGLNDGADEVLSCRGRMIARNDDVGWKLRRNRLVSGGSMPFVLDPSRFFEALQALPARAMSVRNHKASTYKDRDVLIIGITLQGEDAQDFALSGALPAVSAGMGGGGMMVLQRLGGGLGGVAADLPDLTVDLAVYVEPATGYIHKVKSRCYQESAGGAGVQIQIQGGGGLGGGDLEEEEEEVQEKDKDGKRIYKRGLPVRKLGENLSRMDYDIVFTKHDQAIQLKLDPRAKKLLRLGR